jgi:hypothetical protein
MVSGSMAAATSGVRFMSLRIGLPLRRENDRE